MWPFASQPASVLKGSWQSTYAKMLHLFKCESKGVGGSVFCSEGFGTYAPMFHKSLEATSSLIAIPRVTGVLKRILWRMSAEDSGIGRGILITSAVYRGWVQNILEKR